MEQAFLCESGFTGLKDLQDKFLLFPGASIQLLPHSVCESPDSLSYSFLRWCELVAHTVLS
jgi:hypothetical protein